MGVGDLPHLEERRCNDAGHNTNVGDEGGFAPNLQVGRRGARLSSWRRSRRPATSPASDVMLALDSASTEFFKDGEYDLEGEGKTPSIRRSMVEYLAELVARYPIVSIEDGMAEDDLDGWKLLTDAIGKQVPAGRRRSVRHQFDAARRRASSSGIANSILIKVNQIGTLTETLDAVEMAHKAGYTRGDVAPFRRDRGFHHRRPGGRHQLRADQDRLAGALRPAREIQSAAPDRGTARRSGGLCRALGSALISLRALESLLFSS